MAAAFRKHVKQSVSDVGSGDKVKKCVDHNEEDIKLVCIQCNGKPICLMCTHLSHKSHEFVEIKDYLTNAKKSISENLVQLQKRMKTIENAKGEIGTTLEKMKKREKEIEGKINIEFEKMQQVLIKRKQFLIDSLHSISKSKGNYSIYFGQVNWT